MASDADPMRETVLGVICDLHSIVVTHPPSPLLRLFSGNQWLHTSPLLRLFSRNQWLIPPSQPYSLPQTDKCVNASPRSPGPWAPGVVDMGGLPQLPPPRPQPGSSGNKDSWMAKTGNGRLSGNNTPRHSRRVSCRGSSSVGSLNTLQSICLLSGNLCY